MVNPCLGVVLNAENPRLRDTTVGEFRALGDACRESKGVHSLCGLTAIRMLLLC